MIKNGILIAGVHCALSMFLLWGCLYIFNDTYDHEVFVSRVPEMYSTGWIESFVMFSIVMLIFKGYNVYQEQQLKIFDLQREISLGIIPIDNTPWSQPSPRDSLPGYEEVQPAYSSERRILTWPVNDNYLVPSMGPSTVQLNPRRGIYIDHNVVAPCFYDQFHSLLPQENRETGITIGVISPNPGEGKTLVASNLAVSLATGYQKKTVLIDFNMRQPNLHHIFDVALSPGLVEVMDGSLGNHIHVSATPVKGLFVLTAGGVELGISEMAHAPGVSTNGSIHDARERPSLGMNHLSVFFDVISALEREFDCVVIDMPSVNTGDFPSLLFTRLGRFLAVVNTLKTKQTDIAEMMTRVNEHRIMGFVMNQVESPA